MNKKCEKHEECNNAPVMFELRYTEKGGKFVEEPLYLCLLHFHDLAEYLMKDIAERLLRDAAEEKN